MMKEEDVVRTNCKFNNPVHPFSNGTESHSRGNTVHAQNLSAWWARALASGSWVWHSEGVITRSVGQIWALCNLTQQGCLREPALSLCKLCSPLASQCEPGAQ